MKKTLNLLTLCIFTGLSSFAQTKAQQADTVVVDEKIFMKVERESAFPGGVSAWAKFLNENLQYPKHARKKNIEGTVIVQFIVDKQGNVTDITSIQGPEELRAEAERVMKLSPKWIPAQQFGRLVKSYKKQPITFRLQ